MGWWITLGVVVYLAGVLFVAAMIGVGKGKR